MILSAIDWLSISINLLLFLFVIICLVMSMIILMQRPKNEGLGAAFGSGATDQLFGARTTNVLQKGTVYLATLFFVLTLTLAILISKRNANRVTNVAEAPVEEAAPAVVEEPQIEPEAVTPPISVPPLEQTPAGEEEAPAAEEEAPAVEEEAPAGDEEAPAPEEEAPVEPEAPAEEP